MTKRAAFTKTVTRLLGEDESLCLLLGDIGTWGFRPAFEKYPSRCINIGICEGASVSVAAGLAISGLYPIYSTISAFLLRRAFEFLYLDFGIQRLSGLFVGIGGRNEYAKLGPTHCCEHESKLVGCIPGMQYYAPTTDENVGQVISKAVSNRELAYISLEETA